MFAWMCIYVVLCMWVFEVFCRCCCYFVDRTCNGNVGRIMSMRLYVQCCETEDFLALELRAAAFDLEKALHLNFSDKNLTLFLLLEF